MEFTFGMLAVWLFIFYVERSIVKADGMPFLAIIFEASPCGGLVSCIPFPNPYFLRHPCDADRFCCNEPAVYYCIPNNAFSSFASSLIVFANIGRRTVVQNGQVL